jgi:hypothetical protein
MRPKIYFIPDIHGRADLLQELLDLLALKGADWSRDQLVTGGDYVDRGPNSRKVIEILHNLQARHKRNVTLLAGNHEWLMIDAYVAKKDGAESWKDKVYLWMMNGGDTTLANYEGAWENTTLREHVKWLASLPLSHEIERDGIKYFFSHAPVPVESRRLVMNQGQPYTKQELIWTYLASEDHVYALRPDVKGVCGHIHALRHQLSKGQMPEPRIYPKGHRGPRDGGYIFADAGCGCHPKAPLVAVEVQTDEVIYAWPTEAQETMS